ncbi:MAG: hypothetical protein KDH96_00510 [Candidatus Riesia sp.]|nr:hypothetical protein [Candidatus Riesia sp.]
MFIMLTVINTNVMSNNSGIKDVQTLYTANDIQDINVCVNLMHTYNDWKKKQERQDLVLSQSFFKDEIIFTNANGFVACYGHIMVIGSVKDDFGYMNDDGTFLYNASILFDSTDVSSFLSEVQKHNAEYAIVDKNFLLNLYCKTIVDEISIHESYDEDYYGSGIGMYDMLADEDFQAIFQ